MLEKDLDLDFARHKSTLRSASTAGKFEPTATKVPPGGLIGIADLVEDDASIAERERVMAQRPKTGPARNQPFITFE